MKIHQINGNITLESNNEIIRTFEIRYKGVAEITSLLSDSFIIRMNSNKIIIINFGNSNPIDIISYKGTMKILSCRATYSDLSQEFIQIEVNTNVLSEMNNSINSSDLHPEKAGNTYKYQNATSKSLKDIDGNIIGGDDDLNIKKATLDLIKELRKNR